ncbi:uncharacterized protein LOC126970719 [Leptidea sinapis]|uniref:uncharacterized protein LOC126970719 n=1 Tax=Leptidea sinapis TaxID=189913 RepID=UPI0021C35C93|nr:uncharacterized protein LOC126970719 [Leptidea sinapis]
MEKSSEIEIDKFYVDLGRAKEKSTENIIIIGDFNAKIGISPVQIGSVIGRYGSGASNERGEKLKQFAIDQELTILNTMYKKKENHRWTWLSPDGYTKNEIDYILSNKKHYFTNIEVLRKLAFPSDHRLLRGTIIINERRKNRKKYTQPRPILQSIREQKRYKNILQEKLYKHESTDKEKLTIQQLYDILEKSLTESIIESQVSKPKETFTLSDNIKSLISRRHTLQQKSDRTIEEKIDLKELYRIIPRIIQDDYDNYKLKRYEKCIEH